MIGTPICIAITDDPSSLIAFGRIDEGKITSIAITQGKVFTVSAIRKA